MRDAFPPPICVYGLFTRFVWVVDFVCVDYACGRLVAFGWIARGRLMSFGQIACERLTSFGWIARGRLMSLGRIAREWLFGLCGIAWKNMIEIGRGGACVPARVALQGRIHRSIPRTQCVCFCHGNIVKFPAYNACVFCYGNAAARTFGRARRHRPYGFVWRIAYGWFCLLVGENGAHEPTLSVLYF